MDEQRAEAGQQLALHFNARSPPPHTTPDHTPPPAIAQHTVCSLAVLMVHLGRAQIEHHPAETEPIAALHAQLARACAARRQAPQLRPVLDRPQQGAVPSMLILIDRERRVLRLSGESCAALQGLELRSKASALHHVHSQYMHNFLLHYLSRVLLLPGC